MASARATAVLVVGMHRSGTSALAGVLGKLGIPLGSRLLEAGDDNPKGYWEHRDVVVVHERLLQAIGSRWDDVRALPSDWRSGEAATHAAASLRDIITRDFSGQPVWAVKDPRLCRFLPLWLNVLGEVGIRPVVLFIVREPAEVSASIEARNHWVPPLGEILWLRNVADAIVASVDVPREVILFDNLLAQPEEVTRGALSRLGVAIPASPPDLARDTVASFVDKSIRHHRHDAKAAPSSGFARIAHDLFGALAAVAHGATGWPDLEKNVEQFEAEWLRCGPGIDAVADMAMKFAAEARESEIERYGLAAQLNAQVRWSEQSKQKHEALQAENAELSSKLTAQIRWSQEAQQQKEALQADESELSSKLTAQIRWSDEAQKRNEALQAENAELSLKLAAQVESSEQAASKLESLRTEYAVLQAGNAELSSKLEAQTRGAAQAKSELEGLRAKQATLQTENAELSSKLEAQTRGAAQAKSELEALGTKHAALSTTSEAQARRLFDAQAALDSSESTRRELSATLQRALEEAVRVRTDLANVLEGKIALEGELRTVYASRSWRATKPFRSVARFFGAKIASQTTDESDKT